MSSDGTLPAPSKSRQSADRFAAHFKRAIDNYKDHWQEWIVPMLVAGVVTFTSWMLCCLPYLLAIGPLVCGLYHCAFAAYEGRRVHTGLLNQGLETAGSAILATLLILIITALPILLMYGAFFVLMMVLVGTTGPGPNPQEPPPAVILGVFGFYVVMFAAMFLFLVWQLWFSTRTMFVFPLIAQRRMSVGEAWSASWRETKNSFWELLVLNLLAQVIAAIGANILYVGLLFTVPFAMTLRTSVYLERFGDGLRAEHDTTDEATS